MKRQVGAEFFDVYSILDVTVTSFVDLWSSERTILTSWHIWLAHYFLKINFHPPAVPYQASGINTYMHATNHQFKHVIHEFINTNKSIFVYTSVKGAATDMRYFARSKFSRSLVHKKNFSLIWQVVFKLGYVFCHER